MELNVFKLVIIILLTCIVVVAAINVKVISTPTPDTNQVIVSGIDYFPTPNPDFGDYGLVYYYPKRDGDVIEICQVKDGIIKWSVSDRTNLEGK